MSGFDIFVMSALDGTGKVNLTPTAEGAVDPQEADPAFSPDGKTIAYERSNGFVAYIDADAFLPS